MKKDKKTVGFSDEELTEIFSVFESVHVPAEVAESTLGAMSCSSEGRGDAAVSLAAEKAKRPRFRVRKVAAIALVACLLLGCLGGGIAYAVPTAQVSFQGVPSIELGVNCFGVTVTASASNEEGQQLLSQVDVRNKSYGDSLRALLQTAQTLGMVSSDKKVAVTVKSGSSKQSSSLTDASCSVVSDLGCSEAVTTPAKAPDASTASSSDKTTDTSASKKGSTSSASSDADNSSGSKTPSNRKSDSGNTTTPQGGSTGSSSVPSPQTGSSSSSSQQGSSSGSSAATSGGNGGNSSSGNTGAGTGTSGNKRATQTDPGQSRSGSDNPSKNRSPWSGGLPWSW